MDTELNNTSNTTNKCNTLLCVVSSIHIMSSSIMIDLGFVTLLSNRMEALSDTTVSTMAASKSVANILSATTDPSETHRQSSPLFCPLLSCMNPVYSTHHVPFTQILIQSFNLHIRLTISASLQVFQLALYSSHVYRIPPSPKFLLLLAALHYLCSNIIP
jgi:hypothetical protein